VRAYVITAPNSGAVAEVDEPVVGSEDLLIEVLRAGICGTDVEFFTGEMAYLASGDAEFPLRIGHEWCGRVIHVGTAVDKSWIGKLVTSDTMLGCQKCSRCTSGYQYLCEDRHEVGIRRGYAGALAEKIVVPLFAVHQLPDDMDPALGAMAEPIGNALRSVDAADIHSGERILIFGPGTIGLLCAMIAQSRGVEVHIAGVDTASLNFAKQFGFAGVHHINQIPEKTFNAIIDATYGSDIPSQALELIEPGRTVVLIGISVTPSTIDSRTIILKDLTVTGILSASPGLKGAIELLKSGAIDPLPLIAGVVSLESTSAVLSGDRSSVEGDGPKIHIRP
jgi:2-desacetyl-2-hydroxyethyl bacteriochlorophyllide A dehydrogenase